MSDEARLDPMHYWAKIARATARIAQHAEMGHIVHESDGRRPHVVAICQGCAFLMEGPTLDYIADHLDACFPPASLTAKAE